MNALMPDHPTPRDHEVKDVAARLVAEFAFNEAAAVLLARIKEIRAQRMTRDQELFLEWSEIDPAERPDFLTYAHTKRLKALGM